MLTRRSLARHRPREQISFEARGLIMFVAGTPVVHWERGLAYIHSLSVLQDALAGFDPIRWSKVCVSSHRACDCSMRRGEARPRL